MNDRKEYSIAVILHATGRARYEGKKERDIADYLGVDPSNISKYKNGKSILSPNNIRLLIKQYGQPVRESGVYLETEICDTVESYIARTEKRLINGITRVLCDYFNNSQVLKSIADIVSDQVVEPPFVFSPCCADHNVPRVLEWLAENINTEVFKNWYETYLRHMQSRNIDDIQKHHFIEPKELRLGQQSDEWKQSAIGQHQNPLFHLLGYYHRIDPNFTVAAPKPTPVTKDTRSIHEVVLTGSPILTMRSDAINADIAPIEIFIKTQPVATPSLHLNDRFAERSPETVKYLYLALKKALLRKSSIELYLNPDMQYRVKITETWGDDNVSTVIIRHLPADRIVELYTQLQEFFLVDISKETELKTAIAERGGFLPGVTLL
tara:strand:- start:7663 stop:8802 length:1140 start_codon:yes stop_codon:yes gene_type:complete